MGETGRRAGSGEDRRERTGSEETQRRAQKTGGRSGEDTSERTSKADKTDGGGDKEMSWSSRQEQSGEDTTERTRKAENI